MIDVEAVFRAEAANVVRILRRRFPRAGHDLIDDACAQAWAVAWSQRDRVQPDNPLGWVVVVATHELYALLRRRARESTTALPMADVVPATHCDPELALEAREALAVLCALKPQQRDALALRAGGYRYKEIEALLGRTSTWVNRHLKEGRQALRELAP